MRFSVDGRDFDVDVAAGHVKVDGKPFKVDIKNKVGECTAVHVDGMPYQVEVKERRGDEVIVAIGAKTFTVVLPAPVVAPRVAAAPTPPPPPAPVPVVASPAAAPEAKAAPKVEPRQEQPKVVIKEEPPVCDMPFLDGVNAVMPGRILSIKVQDGQVVKMGTVLCILEAMKMENEIRAPKDGTVTNIQVKDGAIVNGGDLLMQVC